MNKTKPTPGRQRNWLSLSGNITLGAALLLALYLLLDRFVISPAPAGTCPLVSNRPLLYLALGLCLISLVLSFFEKKKPGA